MSLDTKALSDINAQIEMLKRAFDSGNMNEIEDAVNKVSKTALTCTFKKSQLVEISPAPSAVVLQILNKADDRSWVTIFRALGTKAIRL
jgi:ankyrin repeat protein